jgi:hypothetical protein
VATKIYCPHCQWVPSPHDRWICMPGCRTVWNTFETRARCPGCQKQWRVTVCPACLASSLHEDWYHDEATDWDEIERASEREGELEEIGAA